jgi:hypothetical protein
MNSVNYPLADPSPSVSSAPRPSLLARLLRFSAYLLGAAGMFVAYEHFKLNGQSTPSLLSLVGAAGLALLPLRAVLHEVFAVEHKVLHVVHALGGLALVALPLSGVVSGAPLLTHAAMAPFAIMGAAQAVMHQNHPRNARQAEALQRFATSLPEVAQFANAKDLTSPANAARAISVMSDLLGKAQALGQTELDADPGFQAALRSATTRVGLGLGLDAIEHSLNVMATSHVAASAVPELRQRLAQVRRINAKDYPAISN